MSRWLSRFFILGVSVFLTSGAAADQKLSPSQIHSLRALVKTAMENSHIPGGSAAIGHNDEILWAEGFGYSDLESKVPATPATLFRTASIGKGMTATAVMQLAEQGKIDLDATVQTYCSEFPAKKWPVTVRQVLMHQSGVRSPTEDETYLLGHYDQVSESLALFKADSLRFRPGDDFLYTTWGYVLLGCVLEGATGEPYRAFMKRTIFDPAGMAHTREDDPRDVIPNRARGYVLEEGTLRNSRWADMSGKLPAGGWLTTPSDLVRFANRWLGGRFVSAKTMDLMLTPGKLNDGSTVDQFGIGWWIDSYRGMRAGFHGGGTPQVSGMLYFVPAEKLAIAVLFNLENIPAEERLALMRSMADVVLGHASKS